MITDITLFNRYSYEHDYLYQRFFLYKVEWGEPKFTFGVPAKYNTLIRIPVLQTLNYKSPREWKKAKENYWTLQLEDVIVKGTVEAQLNTFTLDMYELYTLTDLKKNFETVTIVDLQTKDVPISQQTIDVGVS